MKNFEGVSDEALALLYVKVITVRLMSYSVAPRQSCSLTSCS